MKTYLADIIPKIQRFSQKLDDLTKLTNQHWVCIDDIESVKRVYIFRGNKQLLISDNGVVEKGAWEYLGNQSLLIDTKEGSFLLKHGFFDQNVIALKLDSTNNYVFFVNENKYDSELNNIDDILSFLSEKYIVDNYLGIEMDSEGTVSYELSYLSDVGYISNEQREWMTNPDKCPGCGFSGIQDKSECPDCGLHLT